MHKRVLFLLTLGIAGALMTRAYIFEAIYVASDSMSPTLYLNTHYIVNKLVYRFREPKRGEIIVFHDPTNFELGTIKRVIAIPGDRIALKEKKVILNDVALAEPYTKYIRQNERLTGDSMETLTIPPGHVFVMGDNRDVSMDSTSWKDPKTGEAIHFLPMTHIKGKLIQMP